MTMFTCCKRVEVRPSIVINSPEHSQKSPYGMNGTDNQNNFSDISEMSTALYGIQKTSPDSTRRGSNVSLESAPTFKNWSSINVNVVIGSTEASEFASENPDTEAKLVNGTTTTNGTNGTNGIFGGIVSSLCRIFKPF